jgi:hypothetical protein
MFQSEFADQLWLSGAAGLVMIGFGVSALRGGGGDDDAGEAPARAGHPVLVSAAVLAFAELGDKTQLSVATLAAVADPLGAWLGATLALLLTSTVAAVAERLTPVGGWAVVAWVVQVLVAMWWWGQGPPWWAQAPQWSGQGPQWWGQVPQWSAQGRRSWGPGPQWCSCRSMIRRRPSFRMPSATRRRP